MSSTKKMMLLGLALWLTGCSSVQGVVRDKTTGSPVPSAVVTIGNRSGTSNATGYYRVSTLGTPGQTVLVDAPGYNIYSETIKPDSPDIIDIELTPKQN